MSTKQVMTQQTTSLSEIQAVVRQLLPSASPITVERMTSGVSTEVYRIQRSEETFYLRLLPEVGAGFTPEALAHSWLVERGVRVPGVIYVTDHHPQLGRSILLTAEIPGRELTLDLGLPHQAQILAEAGKALAVINSIPVQGFGWVCRDQPAANELRAEQPTYAAWVQDLVDGALRHIAAANLLSSPKLAAIREHTAQAIASLGPVEGRLAHGDFDLTHIYQQAGRYTGIIDFGEIRGASQFYDLGHFQIEHRPLLPYLLEGYATVATLPPDYAWQIEFATLLDALHWVSRRLATRRALHPPSLIAIQTALARLDKLG